MTTTQERLLTTLSQLNDERKEKGDLARKLANHFLTGPEQSIMPIENLEAMVTRSTAVFDDYAKKLVDVRSTHGSEERKNKKLTEELERVKTELNQALGEKHRAEVVIVKTRLGVKDDEAEDLFLMKVMSYARAAFGDEYDPERSRKELERVKAELSLLKNTNAVLVDKAERASSERDAVFATMDRHSFHRESDVVADEVDRMLFHMNTTLNGAIKILKDEIAQLRSGQVGSQKLMKMAAANDGDLRDKLVEMRKGVCDAVNNCDWRDTVWMKDGGSPIVGSTFVEHLTSVVDTQLTDDGQMVLCAHEDVNAYGSGDYGKCERCGIDSFPISDEAAGYDFNLCETCGGTGSIGSVVGVEGGGCGFASSECPECKGKSCE